MKKPRKVIDKFFLSNLLLLLNIECVGSAKVQLSFGPSQSPFWYDLHIFIFYFDDATFMCVNWFYCLR